MRELRTPLVRACLFASGDRIDRRDVEYALLPTGSDGDAGLLRRPFGPEFDLGALERALREHYVERALEEAEGVKARAARLLNVSPQTFQNWV